MASTACSYHSTFLPSSHNFNHHHPLVNKTVSITKKGLTQLKYHKRSIRCAREFSDFVGGDLLKPDLGKWLADVEEHKAIAIYSPHEGGYEGRYLNRLRYQGYRFLDLSARGLGDPETTLTKLHPVCPAHIGKQPIARWYFPPEVDYRLSLLPPDAKGLVVWILEAKVLSKAELQFLALLPTLRPKVRVIAECGNWRKFVWTPLKDIAGLTANEARNMLDAAVEDKIMAATEKKIDKLTTEPKVIQEKNNNENQSVSRKRHLFGREKPLHAALGSGKTADILLWRQKQLSGAIFVSATVIWLLFERIGYHLLPFLCHFLILTLAILFLWSNLSSFVNRAPPKFPNIRLSQEMCDAIALLVMDQINQASLFLREMTTGRDLKRFMSVILTLWVVSVIGGWFEFLTLVYILFVLMLSAPLLYERNENLVDAYGEKAGNEILAALEKLPVPFFKNNKQH